MIEIDLLPESKSFQLPVVMGIDLNLLNIRMLIIAYIVSFFPNWFLKDDWPADLAKANKKIQVAQQELKKINRKLKGQDEIKKIIGDLNRKEEKLKERLKVVGEIIGRKKSPMKIMLHFSKYIPTDVWLTDFNLHEDKIDIKGESKDYPSIGKFIENLKASVYFESASVILVNSKTKDSDKKIRTEEFEITAKIVRYD